MQTMMKLMENNFPNTLKKCDENEFRDMKMKAQKVKLKKNKKNGENAYCVNGGKKEMLLSRRNLDKKSGFTEFFFRIEDKIRSY